MDLVNEKDEVIGEVWKSEAHNNPQIIHIEIAILLTDDKHRVLLQQRSKLKKLKPGYWTIASSGHIKKGEEPEIAAHRELFEELGFDTELKFVKKSFMQSANESRFFYHYFGKYNKRDFVLQIKEVEQVKYFNISEFLELEKTGRIEELSGKWCKEYWGIK